MKVRVLSFSNVLEADPEGKDLLCFPVLDKVYWNVLWWRLQPSHENILSEKSAKSEEVVRPISRVSGSRASLCLEDELLMTLLRLRLSRLEQDLVYEFGVHKGTVSRIFIKWINYLYLCLGDEPHWPT